MKQADGTIIEEGKIGATRKELCDFADRLADAVRCNWFPEAYMPSSRTRDLRFPTSLE